MADISTNTDEEETAGTLFYAQPYTLSATGFYFSNLEEYDTQRATCRDDYGQPVEEFEIQFIDGEKIDAQLFNALSIGQATIHPFIDKMNEWEEYEKYKLIIAIGECGYVFDFAEDDPLDFDMDVYEAESLRELAEQFIHDGLYGPIPESLEYYIDYDAIARDLAVDYSETTIAGISFVYRCG